MIALTAILTTLLCVDLHQYYGVPTPSEANCLTIVKKKCTDMLDREALAAICNCDDPPGPISCPPHVFGPPENPDTTFKTWGPASGPNGDLYSFTNSVSIDAECLAWVVLATVNIDDCSCQYDFFYGMTRVNVHFRKVTAPVECYVNTIG